LGIALARLHQLDRAEIAFRTALSMAPGMINAHRWLIALYRHRGTGQDKIAFHQDTIAGLKRRRQAVS
jgi:hypothetical protein